ncbi:glycosyltransferase WbsX family protein [Luminiphilus sp. nBUS_07]|uniref:glycosyltransferase WbsX family protein n=1 Tax=Luminiphilus sp. nBUS_07 TaxID=3395314 RepID=UPI003EBFB9D8
MKSNSRKQKFIAFYLPQYHRIPENDEWWGDGFTEWVTTSSARPLFKGHEQPNIPADLGFYNLLNPADQAAQSELALASGLDAFCYWHYWLGDGRMLLDGPRNLLLRNEQVRLPFCLGWANHDWKGVFFGAKNRLLIKQRYPGKADIDAHFYELLPSFEDERYFKLRGRLLFYIFKPRDLPDTHQFVERWRTLAQLERIPDFYFVGEGLSVGQAKSMGFDASAYSRHRFIENEGHRNRYLSFLYRKLRGLVGLRVEDYQDAIRYFLKPGMIEEGEWPSLVPGWDTTPRLGRNAFILRGRKPDLWKKHLLDAVARSRHIEEEFPLFIKSWNEWAEGNYLEPDRRYGRAFLNAFKEVCEDLSEP